MRFWMRLKRFLGYWREALCIGIVIAVVVCVSLKGVPVRKLPRPSAPTYEQEMDDLHVDYARRLNKIEKLPHWKQELEWKAWCKERRNAVREVCDRHGKDYPP